MIPTQSRWFASPSPPLPTPPPRGLRNMPSLRPKPALFNPIFRLTKSGRLRRTSTGGAVRAMDAAQVFDRESEEPEQRARLKIAIVGFGNFGQFLARTFVAQGHAVIGFSRSDHSAAARSLGAAFFRDPPRPRLRRSTLFVDVLSVKEFPKNLFLQLLPPDFDIVCTHPMFGPESGKHGWSGLPFVYDKVRVGDSEDRADRCRHFLDIFAREGCRMVDMSCTEHDENAAEIQFLTHTVGRLLARLDLKSTPINTKGYETLLELVENTCSDSFDLYNGLFMYNNSSTELLERLELAFNSLRKELFGRLHVNLRKQLFQSPNGGSSPGADEN
ncbi:hypothetical protein OPV22_005186 [Ensete ventricosum]|uniref:Prephenate/arogenate dehydrogenase domain-containing protein n=1 Tax=Ensete ventricosum TaxID=4639 RepID=A0AAV8RR01_ENSVE|nr:hypothetical protein OPV22_005186 [Ensete ventricosum]